MSNPDTYTRVRLESVIIDRAAVCIHRDIDHVPMGRSREHPTNPRVHIYIPHFTFQIYKSYITRVEYVFHDMKHPLGARSNIQYCNQLLGAYCVSELD